MFFRVADRVCIAFTTPVVSTDGTASLAVPGSSWTTVLEAKAAAPIHHDERDRRVDLEHRLFQGN